MKLDKLTLGSPARNARQRRSRRNSPEGLLDSLKSILPEAETGETTASRRRARRAPAAEPRPAAAAPAAQARRERRSRAERAPAARGTGRKPRRASMAAEYETERRMPPVVSRSMGAVDMRLRPAAAQARPSAAGRRRFDVALGASGAEIRLPSLPRVDVGWRLASAALVAILSFLIYQVWNSPTYRVSEAAVNGLQRINTEDVNLVLGVADEPIFALNPAEMKARLTEAFPEFSAIQVKVDLPRKVTVTVRERTPILVWKQDGRTMLIDANGFAFPLRREVDRLPPLVVESYSNPPSMGALADQAGAQAYLPVEMVSAILSMGAQSPKDTPLVYDQQHGLGWKDARGWEVYFGDVHEIGMKLNIYQALVKRLKKEEIKPALISVEHVHAPYFRVER